MSCFCVEPAQLMNLRSEGGGDGPDAMGFSFHDAANRRAFLEDEAAYCAKFGLDAGQVAAAQSRRRAADDRGRRQRL